MPLNNFYIQSAVSIFLPSSIVSNYIPQVTRITTNKDYSWGTEKLEKQIFLDFITLSRNVNIQKHYKGARNFDK
jgi:hypothetical protein